jgi:steroid 5-alpha reductase family enzyme
MDKYDALFFFGAILALCGAILAAPLQLHEGNNPGMVLLFVGIVVMIVGIVLKFARKP